MRSFVALMLVVVAAASPLVENPSIDLNCTSDRVERVINHIMSLHPHPDVFCASFFGIPSRIETVHSTVSGSITATSYTTTVATTISTTTSVTTVIEGTTLSTCVFGSPPTKNKEKRWGEDKPYSSEACSCIGPVPGHVTTTKTHYARDSITSEATTTSVTYTTVSTSTTTLSVFMLQVTDYAPPADGATVPDFSGTYLDVSASSSGSQEAALQVLDSGNVYALSACGEVVVIDSPDTTSIGYVMGQNERGYNLVFETTGDTNGFEPAMCSVTDELMLSCSRNGKTKFEDDVNYAQLASQSFPGDGTEDYKVIYVS